MRILRKLIVEDLLAGLSEMLEAEGRQLRDCARQFLTGALVLVAGLCVLLGGFGLILWGLYLLLAPAAGPAGGAFIAGGVAILLAVALHSCARRLTR